MPPVEGEPLEPKSRSRFIAGSPVHYGWIILAAGTFGSFMTMPGQTASVSVFFDPLIADLHITQLEASFAYTIGTLAGILPAPVIGRWIDQKGPRLPATIISFGLVAACGAMALVQSWLALLLGFALLRGAAIGGLSLVSQQVVNLWFVERRGIAAAGASLGLAAGSMVFPILIDALIQVYGWRGAYITLAAIVALTMVPVAAALFRDRPERFGLRPDAGFLRAPRVLRDEPSFTRSQALRTATFWVLCASSFLANAIGTGLLLNHFSVLQAVGLERIAALSLLGPMAGIQAVATLGTGSLIDRMAPKNLVPLSMLTLAAATLFAAFGEGTLYGWLYAAALGIALGSHQAVNAAGFAHYFGRDHLGAIRGASFVFGVGGAAFGPLPFSASIVWTGGYSAVLVGCCALCLLCAVSALVIRSPGAAEPRSL